MASTTTAIDDDQLVQLLAAGDTQALATLLERHLHPAWRIALAASPNAAAAEATVATGVVDALRAAIAGAGDGVSLRTRIAAGVHQAAQAAATAPGVATDVAPHDDAVLAAFLALPVVSRTALWLTEVEGGEPAQVAPVLGVEPGVAASLSVRAASAMRDRLAADAAGRAANPICARALGKLPAHAAGRLTADDRGRVSTHLASCGSCAASLAAIVAPRPALRRLVVPVPEGLAATIVARWAEGETRTAVPLLQRINRRSVGAAAAAMVAIGLTGALILGDGGAVDDGPRLAAPAGAVDLEETARSATATTLALASPVLPTPQSPLTGMASINSAAAARRAPAVAARSTGTADQARGTAPATTATTAPRPTPSTTATTAPPTTSTTNPPAASNGGGGGAPLPIPVVPPTTAPPSGGGGGTQATVELPGATVGLGDCTGANLGGTAVGCDPTSGAPTVEIQLPGLPPVDLLP